MAAPDPPFVVIGDGNLDPVDGDGLSDAITALIDHSALQNTKQARDTADFSAKNGPGKLRVDYVLPSRDLNVIGAGVLWPDPSDPMAEMVASASRHRPVWVDVLMP